MEIEVISKTDGNQAEIVSTLRAAGASVTILAGVGCGCPDLLVGFRGNTILVECKNPGGRGRNSLTPAEIEWFKAWKGEPAAVVNSPEEALSTLFGFLDDLE
jgi:hypothetical protein